MNIWRCIGNLYCTSDDCPFKHSVKGKWNTMNCQNVSGHKVCFCCANVASRQWCNAHKMTEYCRESESHTVYHIGAHKCPLKQDTKIYRKQVRDALLRNRDLGAQGIQQAEVGQVVTNSDVREAQRRAMQLSHANVRSEKAKLS